MRAGLIGFVIAGTALAAHAAPASTLNCGSRSVGPGALIRKNGDGPTCLLRAFQLHGRPATYRLSSFGIDTVATDTFRTVRRGGVCQAAVAISFRVIPQTARLTGSGHCRALKQVGVDVVAGNCTGSGLPASVSVRTGRPPT